MDINFSASDLIKCSAFQLAYVRHHHIKTHTSNYNREKGLAFEDKVAHSIKGSCSEMVTRLDFKGITIFASHDIVTDKCLIEVKSYNPSISSGDWYFKSCLLQSAFYKSIFMLSDGHLATPRFKLNEGYDYEEKNLDINLPYHLRFSDKEYDIKVHNPQKIVSFFYTKAAASLDYETAKTFDASYKHKEFDALKHLFSFDLITHK